MAYTYAPLLEVSDFNNVSTKFDDNHSFDNALRKSQEIDLKNFLGAELYYKLINNIADSSIYEDLWGGTTYVNSIGNTIQLYGVKQWLIEQTNYNYLLIPNIEDTGSGHVFPDNENSKQNIKEQRKVATKQLQTANGYRDNIIKYLNEKRSDYELWKGGLANRWTGGIF